MPARIRFTGSALADLDDVRDWYAREGVPDTGLRLVRAIIDHVEHLASHPDVGRVVPEFGLNSLRELIHPPFRIIYRRDSDTVRIVRVWRSERRLRPIDDGEGESS